MDESCLGEFRFPLLQAMLLMSYGVVHELNHVLFPFVELFKYDAMTVWSGRDSLMWGLTYVAFRFADGDHALTRAFH
jgi:hypothetical protein